MSRDCGIVCVISAMVAASEERDKLSLGGSLVLRIGREEAEEGRMVSLGSFGLPFLLDECICNLCKNAGRLEVEIVGGESSDA